MYQSIITEIDSDVGIITLNRAERHNAFDDILIAELSAAIDIMGNEPAVRVVVLSSTGKSFCAGADLQWMQRMAECSSEEGLQDSRAMAELFRRIAQCPKPVIARVQGPAYGGGAGLIAACDIAIATFDSQFALTEVQFGLIPAAISPHIIAAIGERYARRFMLSGECFSAAEAYRIGLIHDMVADENILDEALSEVINALLTNGPHALRECKDLISAVAWRPLTPELVENTAQRGHRVRASQEGREGVHAFLEKRSPSWVAGA